MQHLFFALFILCAVVHLADSWKDDARRRAATKPLLLLFLILFYLTAADKISWFLLGALVTSWLGDVLLIPKGNKWFLIGGSSFLVSHLLFIGVYLPYINFSRVPWLWILPMAIMYLAMSLCSILMVRENMPKIMNLAMLLYLVANSAMNLCALILALTTFHPGAMVAYAGAVLFFLSDCVLFQVRYHTNPNLIFKRHFSVMLYYLSGEMLITLGMLLFGA